MKTYSDFLVVGIRTLLFPQTQWSPATVCTTVHDAHGHELVRGEGAGLVEQAVGHLARQGNPEGLRAKDARLEQIEGRL